MGKFVEPLIIQGINRDVAPGALDYAGRRVLNPVRDVLNARYLTSEGEQSGKVENIRGTTQLLNEFAVYREVTLNAEFIGSLDPWLQITNGVLPFSWVSDKAQVASSGSGNMASHTMYQINLFGDPKAGELARFSVKMSSTFSSAHVYGRFLDTNLNIIETFHVGGAKTGFADLEFSVLKEIPAGAKHFAVYMNVFGAGVAATASMDYFRIESPILFALPAGLNECIGSFECVEKNALFFWVWNSNGYHGIFKLDGSTEIITQVIADDPNNPVLNFNRNYLITGMGMIGDILTWTDNRAPGARYINVTRAYSNLNDQMISLAKIGPKNPPTVASRAADTTLSFNKLSSDSFQFAYQYVYKDNEISVLSPYSKLSTGDISPEVSGANPKVLVTHTVDAAVSPILKEVRLLYRKNNDPNWFVWKQVRNFSTSIAEYFFNTEQGIAVPEAQATKLFDQVPNRSKALTIFRGRIFLNINEEGFDFTPPTITCSLASDTSFGLADIPALNVFDRGAFLKKNGSYMVGVFFRAKLGHISGINTKGVINGPKLEISSSYNINDSLGLTEASNKVAKKFSVTLTGKGPANCDYFIAITREQNYLSYMQVPAHILWYNFDADLPAANPYNLVKSDALRFYQKNIPGSTYKYIHFLLPKNLPFVPDAECFVRFASGEVTKVERILEVLDGGDIIVTSNFGITNWSSLQNGTKGVPLIEIFKPNTTVEPFFYQIAGPYSTDANGVMQTAVINDLDGDTFYVFPKSFNFKPYQLHQYQGIPNVRQNTVSPWIFVETPSPVCKSAQISTKESLPPQGSPSESGANQIAGRQPDLTKKAFSKGLAIVESKPLLQKRAATLRFSDPYVEGSEINGLNSFPVGNAYDKIGQDRSPITKLLPVGNVLLAVHERHVSSIYVGEGIVRTGDTGFITKVENVIGDDRKLNGQMGSYHPESVQEIDGQAFGLDIYNGVVWRYTVEGLVDISEFGMSNHFKERCEKYFPYRDSLKFVSAIDSYHKEYMIALPHLYLHKETKPRFTVGVVGTFLYNFVVSTGYTVGQTYRLKIVLFNQASTTTHRVTLDAYFDETPAQAIASGISHKVSTNSEDEADPIYIEFLYSGQTVITLKFSNVTEDIYTVASSEYQEVTGETWAYNYKAKEWSHRYEFVPGYMGKIGSKVILFDKGKVYKHSDSDTYNNFFGRQFKRKITVSANPQPNKNKVWSAVQFHCDVLSVDNTLKVIEVANDAGQASYTRAKEFDKVNGAFFGSILKDVNTNPLLLSAGQIALRDGKDIRSETLDVTITNDSTTAARMQKINLLGEHSEFSI